MTIMKCEQYGCFYKVEDGVLFYCATLKDGKPDLDWCEVTALPDGDDNHLAKINQVFGTQFKPETIDRRHP
jgi:hypothetical protein